MITHYKIALFKNNKDTCPKNEKVSYDQLIKLLTTFHPNTKENASAIVSGNYSTGRKTENLSGKSLLFLDIDKFEGNLTALEAVLEWVLGAYQYIAYSTSSHTLETPRIRIVLPLWEEVDIIQYEIVSKVFIDYLENLKDSVDPSSTKPNQLMYLPIIPNKKYIPWYKINSGVQVDPQIFGKSNSPKEDKNEDNLLKITINSPLDISEQEIIDYLKEYPASDCDNHQWIEVAMALHHQYDGKERGLKIWNEWSKKDKRIYCVDEITGKERPQYPGLDYLKYRWENFDNNKNNPITFASIISHIKEKNKKECKVSGVNFHKLVPVEKWIDIKTKGIKNPVTVPLDTLENFQVLLDFYNIVLQYDVIKKINIIKIDNIVQTNNSSAATEIQSLCNRNHLPVKKIHDSIACVSNKNNINYWKKWIESEKWDGQDRFEEFCNTVTLESKYIEARNFFLKQWLIQMLHITCLNEGDIPKNARSVLIFQGKQGIGKTTWLTSLVPSYMREYVLVGQSIDPNDKDMVIAAISHVLVELGEITSTFRKADIEALKNFISKPLDNIRLPYERHRENYRRTTVFFGTSNETNFLKDNENSRFLVLPVIKCDFSHNINMQQLYAQLLIEAKTITDYNLSPDERKIQIEINEEFEIENPIENIFIKAVEIDSKKLTEEIYSATDVLLKIGYDLPKTGKFARTLTNEMAKILNKYGEKNKARKPFGWHIPPLKETYPTHNSFFPF